MVQSYSATMDIAELVLDYVAVLKWPVLVALLVALLLWRGQELGRFVGGVLRRTQSAEVSAAGVRLTLVPEQDVSSPSAPLPAEEPGDSQVVSELAGELRAQYEETARLDQETGQLREKYLQLGTDYSTVRLYWFYEQVYRLIVPIQHEFILALKAASPRDLPRNEFEARMLLQIPLMPPDWSVDLVAGWLITNRLVEKVEGKEEYRLLELGHGLLEYMNQWGIRPKA